MVYLNQVWFQVLINHHVEAKDLEAELVLHIFGLAWPVNVPHARLSSNQSFNDQVIYTVL